MVLKVSRENPIPIVNGIKLVFKSDYQMKVQCSIESLYMNKLGSNHNKSYDVSDEECDLGCNLF